MKKITVEAKMEMVIYVVLGKTLADIENEYPHLKELLIDMYHVGCVDGWYEKIKEELEL